MCSREHWANKERLAVVDVKSRPVLHLWVNSEISDTSNILISCYFLSIHVPTLIFLSPLFRFFSSLLICFYLTLPYYHAIDNHVVPFSSCSHSMYWLNLMFLNRSSPELRYWFPLCPLISEHLLYLNHVSSSIQGNLIICVTCISFSPCVLFVLLHVSSPTTSDLCLTSVRLPSDSGLWPPSQNYRTYLLIVRVGATHKLKPSPTSYPPLITRWPSPTQLRTSDSGLPPESTPNSWEGKRQKREVYSSQQDKCD